MGQVQTTPAPTIADILDRFQRDYLPRLSPRTQRDYARHLVVLRKWFGHRLPDDLKPRELGAFLAVEKGKIQKNRQMAVLSCALSEAVGRWYMCERNPCKDVKRNPSRHRNRYVTDVEYAGVKLMAPKRVRLAMDLSLLTGQRQGDVIGFRWDHVKDMHIHVQQGKTGKRLAIEISPALEAVLDECWKLPKGGCEGGEYVITRRCGGRYTSEGFRALWQRTINQWVKLGNLRFNFHDIRAKSASDSESIDAAYQRLGHQDISITRQVYDRGVRIVKPLK